MLRSFAHDVVKDKPTATVREGAAPVLLVVDVQAGVMREARDASRVIGNVARVVARARARDVPLVWVQHPDEDLPHGSKAWQWVPELVSARGEQRLHKHFNSSFEQTSLEDELAALARPISCWLARQPTGASVPRPAPLSIEATTSP
ncbi:MAG: isochorismatase family protein [Burkholderiaceae bacterium]|nr:isochorismatase family protein [Burkholderiaceae bacterium]